ncbi:hypothetical protein COCON_G00042570 [Conger conger]|uniref:Uncharacterized protein n=1 Tax=Conger conger TaxID=82655 RepID=A0A9Q1DU01_CONCO|nr:hypothetical protein COCON_G00042570 [Conger conger]
MTSCRCGERDPLVLSVCLRAATERGLGVTLSRLLIFARWNSSQIFGVAAACKVIL